MPSTLHQVTTIIEALHNLKRRGAIDFMAFSDDWIIAFWRGRERHLMYANKLDINSAVSSDIATDKVAAYQLLAHSQVPAVPHYLLTTPVASNADQSYLESLFDQHGELVIKPTFGRKGQNVIRCARLSEALEIVQNTAVDSWSASPFIDIQRELRLVVQRGSVQLAYEKQDPVIVQGLKMFNLHLGATPKRLDVQAINDQLVGIARHAMEAIGLVLGAVDIAIDKQGKPYVLEINSNFSVERYAASSSRSRQEAITFYEQAILSCFQSHPHG